MIAGYFCKCKYCGRQEMHFGNCEGCGAPLMFELKSVSLKNYYIPNLKSYKPMHVYTTRCV